MKGTAAAGAGAAAAAAAATKKQQTITTMTLSSQQQQHQGCGLHKNITPQRRERKKFSALLLPFHLFFIITLFRRVFILTFIFATIPPSFSPYLSSHPCLLPLILSVTDHSSLRALFLLFHASVF